MPGEKRFLKGFNLGPDRKIAGFVLSDATASETPIKRYSEYEYDVWLYFRGQATEKNYQRLEQALSNLGDQIIYTSYGNPYLCQLNNPQIVAGNRSGFTVTMQGVCSRKYV